MVTVVHALLLSPHSRIECIPLPLPPTHTSALTSTTSTVSCSLSPPPFAPPWSSHTPSSPPYQPIFTHLQAPFPPPPAPHKHTCADQHHVHCQLLLVPPLAGLKLKYNLLTLTARTVHLGGGGGGGKGRKRRCTQDKSWAGVSKVWKEAPPGGGGVGGSSCVIRLVSPGGPNPLSGRCVQAAPAQCADKRKTTKGRHAAHGWQCFALPLRHGVRSLLIVVSPSPWCSA
jgi:hypothetical protein